MHIVDNNRLTDEHYFFMNVNFPVYSSFRMN